MVLFSEDQVNTLWGLNALKLTFFLFCLILVVNTLILFTHYIWIVVTVDEKPTLDGHAFLTEICSSFFEVIE